MATVTHTSATTTGISALGSTVKVIHEVVDFAVMAGDITIGATDTIQVITLPDQALVLAAGVDVLTAESTNTTAECSLGDAGDTARYVDAATMTAGSMTQAATMADGRDAGAAETIDLLLSVAAPTDAKLLVWAVVADISRVETTDRKTYS